MAATGIFKNAIKTGVNNTWTQVYASPATKTSYLIQCDVANIANSGVQISIRVKDNSTSTYAFLVKNAPVPVGSSIQVIDGQKIVLESLDALELICDTTGSTVDVVVSLIEDV
jgi:hypothetical protein